MILEGVPSIKSTNLYFWFSPLPGTRGTRGALGVCWIKKLHKTKSDGRRNFEGSLLQKKYWNSKILVGLPALFSRAVGWKSKFQLPMPRCPNSKKVRHDPLAPTPGVDWFGRNPLFEVRAWPRGRRGPSHPPKNYLLEVNWTLKILHGSVQRVKSYGTFLQGHADTQTKTNHLTTTIDFLLPICEGVRREILWTLQKFYLFTSWKINWFMVVDLRIMKLLTCKVASRISNMFRMYIFLLDLSG